MRYTDDYMYSKDIDWFCSVNGKYWIHVASAGGILPNPINDRDCLRNIQHIVYNLPDIYTDEEIIKNDVFLMKRFHEDVMAIKEYLGSFMRMARKGFISIDRTNLTNLEDPNYHIVCRPNNLKSLKQFIEFENFQVDDDSIFFGMNDNIKLLNILK